MNDGVIIFGAGGLARELAEWMIQGGTRVLAFVSDHEREQTDQSTIPTLSRESASERFSSPRFVIGFSDPSMKPRVVSDLLSREWIPTTWISPLAIMARDAVVGIGTVVCPFCTVSPGARIGDYVLLNVGSSIGHDAAVDSHSSLLGRVSINGNAHIGEGCLVGAGALVVPGRRIAARATIGIGSVVVSHVLTGTTVFGNPARRIKS